MNCAGIEFPEVFARLKFRETEVVTYGNRHHFTVKISYCLLKDTFEKNPKEIEILIECHQNCAVEWMRTTFFLSYFTFLERGLRVIDNIETVRKEITKEKMVEVFKAVHVLNLSKDLLGEDYDYITKLVFDNYIKPRPKE